VPDLGAPHTFMCASLHSLYVLKAAKTGSRCQNRGSRRPSPQ
jgi:hypothetical protein